MATSERNLKNAKSGPLAPLYTSNYEFTGHRYPSNIATSTKGHYINFYINAAEKSKYIEGGQNQKFKIIKDKNGNVVTGTKQTLQDKEANQVGSVAINVAGAEISLRRKTKRINRAISLYMPETMSVQYNADWQDTSITEAFGKLGGIAQVGKSVFDESKQTGDLNQALRNLSYSPAVAEGIGTYAESLIGNGGLKQIAQFTTGTALNPQLEVLFTGTHMREFQFDFLFTPKDKEETEAVKNIIKEFKFHMAPEIFEGIGGGRYLTPPSEFDIEFMRNGTENKNIHKISTCVLSNMNVDYAPSGWTTYKDGMPVQTRMTLQFKEIEIMTKQRIEQGF